MVLFGDFGRQGIGRGEPAPTVLHEVRAYWESLRAEGRLPLRKDIDPRGLASALDKVFLIEQIAPGQARFRLAGNQFHDLMSMDVRGMPLSALFETVSRERLRIGLQGVFDDAAALHIGIEAERGIGRPALAGRMLLLPLRGGAEEPILALGVLSCKGQIGRAPRRFAITTIRTEVLLQSQITTRILRRRDPSAPPDIREPRRETPARGPELRLVHSRDDVRSGA